MMKCEKYLQLEEELKLICLEFLELVENDEFITKELFDSFEHLSRGLYYQGQYNQKQGEPL